MSGQTVPAADLDLETTQNPTGVCVTSVEAYVASVTGASLVYEVITAGTFQGSFQSPLALGDLTHDGAAAVLRRPGRGADRSPRRPSR